jgi:hypothetical protein
VIDAARRKGKTSVELKRLARDRIAFRNWTRTQRCKAIGINKEEEDNLRFSQSCI